MNRTAARALALAALAILALGIAAATLDSAVPTSAGGDFGVGPGPSSTGNMSTGQSGAPSSADVLRSGSTEPIMPCFPVLATSGAKLAILVGFLAVAGAIYWLTRSIIPVVAAVVTLAVPTALIHAMLTACVSSNSSTPIGAILPSGNASSLLPPGGGGASGSGQAVTTPTVVFSMVVLLALFGVIGMLLLSTGDDETEEPVASESDESEPDVAAIGQAAGEAADRIEQEADLENEVYRAWAEMTESLDVARPESSTPAEFAAAAVDAGMDSEDVNELTDLFEEVRYGGADPTEERERRAIDALRRIESTYADRSNGARTASESQNNSDT